MTDSRPETTVARVLLASLCGWEFLALTTRRIPTVSTTLWRLPMWKRLPIVLTGTAIFLDHATTRRWS